MSNDNLAKLYQKSEVCRTHDKFYLSEDRKEQPKEYFKFIVKVAGKLLEKDNITAIDVGCATGDFVYFLKKNFPNLQLSGMDIDYELLEKAQSEVDDVNFFQGSIADAKLPSLYDVIFINGVHSIFDDFEWLDNLLSSLEGNGSLYIFGLFNPEDLDVLIKSRPAGTSDKWETGWNLYSKKTALSYVEKRGFSGTFFDFELGIDLKKNESDPLRSWTEKMIDGRRIIVNGLQLVNTLSLMEVKRKA